MTYVMKLKLNNLFFTMFTFKMLKQRNLETMYSTFAHFHLIIVIT